MASSLSFTERYPELSLSIRSVDKEDLPNMLMRICEASPECLAQAYKVFLVSEEIVAEMEALNRGDSEPPDQNDNVKEEKDTVESSPGPKRKRAKIDSGSEIKSPSALLARFRRCKTCNESYDITENDDEACITHSGKDTRFPHDDTYIPQYALTDAITIGGREMLESFREDFDSDPGSPGGEIDTITPDWRVLDFPEYFPWTCCSKPADDEGCVIQNHVPS